MKKTFYGFAIYLISMCVVSCTSDEAPGLNTLSRAVPETSLDLASSIPEANMQDEAYRSYEKLMSTFVSQARAITEVVYPESYGGSYVNENGKLVILLAETKSREAVGLRNLLSENSVVYSACKYSYNDLNNTVLAIRQKAKAGDDFVYENVGLYGVDNERNSVVVGLYDDSEAVIKQFKERIIDSPSIQFAKCTSIQDHSLSCADSIGVTGSRASVGYRAKDKSGNIGIVTAAHFITKGEILRDPVKFLQIGECLDSRLDDGTVDAAFCRVDSKDYAPTNRIAFMANPAADTLSIDLAQPPANLYVNMVGMRSKRQSGTVYSPSFDVIISGKKILTDVILATYSTQSGDSGGIIYALTSSTNKRSTVGINKGSLTISISGQVKTYGVCIKAYMINSTLGIQRY